MPLLDPVAAYDLVAPEYAAISETRRAYLRAVEDLIVGDIQGQPRSMLDVGAGNGSRALRIAERIGIEQLTLLEPSSAMRSYWPTGPVVWPIRAEQLSSKSGGFDLILCLWNVLGHVFPAGARLEVLRQFTRLLHPGGIVYVDLSHRYNMRHYGSFRTLGRMLSDVVQRHSPVGDVPVSWNVEGREIRSSGHVFTSSEFEAVLPAAGLSTERRFVIDYANGRLHRSKYAGHLLYKLRSASR